MDPEFGEGPSFEVPQNGDPVGVNQDYSLSPQNDDLVFPESVQAAIAEVFPSSDPLDAPDFSPVNYINELFPTEQSLTNLDDVVSEMRCKIQCIDDDMRRIVRSQTTVEDEATRSLEEAQMSIMELFTQIRDIKAKAAESEAMVRDITRDIKQLDTAKRNLTTAITTLNHLHMLVGGVSTLRRQTIERQYGDAAMLLQGLLQVLQHFEHYSNIPQIKDMSSQLKQIQETLGTQITNDFHTAFSTENARSFSPSKHLAEACLVVSVLDSNLKVKSNLIKFVLKRQLAEYGIMFADSEDGAWLDKIDNRFNWLKRHLIDFEDHMGPVFPPDWEMSERISVEFCDMTRKALERLMFKRKLEIDTKLLLHAIQRTSNFESLLSRRFTGITLEQYKQSLHEAEHADSNNPFDEPIVPDANNPFFDEATTSSKPGTPKSSAAVDLEPNLTPFNGLISQCFEPYLDIYIETQNQNLSELVERASQEQKNRGYSNLAVEGSSVLHSCGDLFMFYKKCMVQCAQLSTGDPMLALANVFRRHLKDYANKILLAHLPKSSSAGGSIVGSSSTPSLTSMTTTLTKDLKDFSTHGFIQNVQSFLKEGEAIRLTPDERVFVCSAIVTAEYIIETTQQLEGKLKDKVERRLSDKINFSSEQDAYHGIITTSVQLLVQEMELQCDPALSAMTKMPWSTIESVGDQSAYVTSLFNQMKQTIPLVRDNLASSKKYFTQFCIKFANSFIPKFLQSLYKCRPLSTVGAEQLLLDTHSIKTLLLDLPTVGSKVVGNASSASAAAVGSRKAPASYAKIVIKGMTKAEMILKVVMSPAEPAKGFVEQYSKLLGVEADPMELQKVLEMKGIRKVDQTLYLDVFNQFRTPMGLSGIPLLSQSQSQSDLACGGNKKAEAEESRIKKLERLIKKRL